MLKFLTHLLVVLISSLFFVDLSAQYQYIGTYDNQGRPNYLVNPSDIISATFKNSITTTLPEYRPLPIYNPRLITDGRTETIDLKCTSDVWITFVDEGASYRNGLGYYTFNTDNPPTVAPTASQIKIIFPNASKSGFGGTLIAGDKVFLGNFPAKTGIGFVLMADGWNGTIVTSGNWTLFSNASFNPETNASDKKHTVLIRDSATNRILVGFEDIRRDNINCDQDFNDLLFYATVSPINCVNNLDSIPTLNADGGLSYSGFTGGLESKSLGDKIAKRVFTKIINGTNGEVNYQNMLLYQTEKNQIQGNGTSTNNGLKLASIMPNSMLDTGFTTYVTTPADIPSITNAIEVRSVDFIQNKMCKAVAFATKTLAAMYEHTKPICDRLKGAELLNIDNFTLNKLNFVRYTLLQENGNIEYAMSFSVGKKIGRNTFSFQSNWLNKDYIAEDTLINYQVWGTAPYLCIDMALDILNKLNAIMPLMQNTKSANLPNSLIIKGKRNGAKINLTIDNKTMFSTGYFEIEERANEIATIKTKRTVPFNMNTLNKSSVSIPISDAFESNIAMFVNGQLQDVVYMSDGTWGIDYDSTKTVIREYKIINDSVNTTTDNYPVFRNVKILATTPNYVSAYKVLRAAGTSENLTSFKSLIFSAKANANCKITLVKNSIANFEQQYKLTIPLGTDLKEYRINLDDFKSVNSTAKIELNDITTIVFAFETTSGSSTNIDLQLNNIAFSKKTAEEVLNQSATLINIFPNPVKGGKFIAQFKSEVNTVLTLKLTDASNGKVIFSKNMNVVKGDNMIPVQVNGLSGLSINILTIEGNGNKFQPKKVVIQQ